MKENRNCEKNKKEKLKEKVRIMKKLLETSDRKKTFEEEQSDDVIEKKFQRHQ